MFRLDFAVMMVAGTLALVGLILIVYFVIRDRLAADPELSDFSRRVEASRLEGQPFPHEAGAQVDQEDRQASDDPSVDAI